MTQREPRSTRRIAPSPGLAERIRQRWHRIPPAWRTALVAASLLRVAVALLALAGGGLLPGLEPVPVVALPERGFGGWAAETAAQQAGGLLGAGLERFDALWYLAIAEHGYPTGPGVPHAAAFFPGFPLATAAVDLVLPGGTYLAGSIVALLATIVAFAGIFHLVAETTGDLDDGRRGVVATAVFPTAFFLVAPYTEALFLAASVWALVLARRRAWWPAAGAAVVAGLTRNVGVLLTLPLAIEAWRTLDRPAVPAVVRRLAAVGAAPLGLAAYLAYGWVRWGEPLAPVTVQAGWQRVVTWPWQSLGDALAFAVGTPGRYATGYHTLDVLVMLPVLAGIVWLLRRAPASLSLYAVAHLGVWLVYPFPSRPLMSVPRFALAAAPLAIAGAALLRHRARQSAWIAWSGALLGVHLLLFVGWYYVF